MGFPRGENVAIYVGNSNTKDALVRGYSETKAINIIIQIFRAFGQRPGARFWFEQVPTNRNIADLPTRGADLPPSTMTTLPFSILNILNGWVTKARKKSDFVLVTNGPAEEKVRRPTRHRR